MFLSSSSPVAILVSQSLLNAFLAPHGVCRYDACRLERPADRLEPGMLAASLFDGGQRSDSRSGPHRSPLRRPHGVLPPERARPRPTGVRRTPRTSDPSRSRPGPAAWRPWASQPSTCSLSPSVKRPPTGASSTMSEGSRGRYPARITDALLITLIHLRATAPVQAVNRRVQFRLAVGDDAPVRCCLRPRRASPFGRPALLERRSPRHVAVALLRRRLASFLSSTSSAHLHGSRYAVY